MMHGQKNIKLFDQVFVDFLQTASVRKSVTSIWINKLFQYQQMRSSTTMYFTPATCFGLTAIISLYLYCYNLQRYDSLVVLMHIKCT